MPAASGPDAKIAGHPAQYINGKPARTTSVVVSIQHDEGDRRRRKMQANLLRPYVLGRALPDGWMPAEEPYFYVNPTGTFRHRRAGRRLRA